MTIFVGYHFPRPQRTFRPSYEKMYQTRTNFDLSHGPRIHRIKCHYLRLFPTRRRNSNLRFESVRFVKQWLPRTHKLQLITSFLLDVTRVTNDRANSSWPRQLSPCRKWPLTGCLRVLEPWDGEGRGWVGGYGEGREMWGKSWYHSFDHPLRRLNNVEWGGFPPLMSSHEIMNTCQIMSLDITVIRQ